jgi:hypothetical protein
VAGGPIAPVTIPFTASVFVGAPVLLLAALGVRRTRATRWLAVAAVVLLWAAMGDALGAGALLAQVPVWNRFRYAEKLVGPLSLLVAVLAAAGADRLAGEAPRWLRPIAGVLAGLAVVAAALLWAMPDRVEALLRLGRAGAAASPARRQLLTGLLHLSGNLAALLALLALHRRWSKSGVFAQVAATLLVGATLGAAVPFALRAGDRAAWRRPAAAEAGAHVRVATPVAPMVSPRGPGALDALTAARSALGMPPLGAPAGVENVDVYVGLYPRRHEYLYAALGGERWRAYRRWGVTHVAVPTGVTERDPVARDAVEGGRRVEGTPPGVELYEVPHRPWVSFASAAVGLPSQRESLLRTIELARAGDPTVVVEAASAPPVAPGRILSEARGVDWLRIDAEAEGDALLVINDAYWPGWQAEIDGRRVDVLPADVLVRAVAWPAGRHRLEMRYAPPEVELGVAVSSIGLACLLGAVLMGTRRRVAPPEDSVTPAARR